MQATKEPEPQAGPHSPERKKHLESISSKEVTLSQSLRAKPSRKGGMNIGANQLGVVFTPAVQSDVVNYRTGARATPAIPSRHPGHPVPVRPIPSRPARPARRTPFPR